MTSHYKGQPFQDSQYPGGPQSIPGKVMCAYYDFGGEGTAYHDTTDKNQGSGMLNPANGTYLNEFRINESVDTTYTKSDGIDDNPFNFVQPEMSIPYIGWTEPGEWLKYTVDVAQAGVYTVNLLYTSNNGGAISLSVDDKDVTGPLTISSTYRDEDDMDWRQWHHWNLAAGITELTLEAGIQVLTLHTVEHGQMNYAYLSFVPKE
ncbi:MAG: carbohydrate-binding protein [Gorillibacterium sp.]|nr:carbohydrate-binding protein [Gorillibacterium sp.]